MSKSRPQLGLITPYYWPEVAASVPLMTSLAEDLVGRGWQVTVLTSQPASNRVTAEDAARSAEGLPKSGLDIVRLRNPFSRRFGVPGKLLEYAWFAAWICFRILFRSGADVYFVSSNPPLMALPVAALARLRGIPVVYNLQDLFPTSAVASGLLRNESALHRVLRYFEVRTYRSVACVAAITHGFRAHVQKLAPGAHVEVVPNWVDLESLSPIANEQNEFAQDYGLEPRQTVALYAGNLGFLHGVGTLLDAAKRLRTEPDLTFMIVGDGQDLHAMQQRVEQENIANVRFAPFQPFARIPHVYSRGDIGIVMMRSGAAAAAVPSKSWNIMACGRPVVAAVDADSELATILQQTGAGIVVPPGDADALAAAIARLHGDARLRAEMGARGRHYVEQHLSRSELTGRYASILADLAHPPAQLAGV